MNRFNSYMGSHFSACRLLAESYDLYRQRKVRIHLIPGEFECVGVTDGTDAWIAPVSPQCFRVDVLKIIKRIRSGEDVAVVREGEPVGRRRLLEDDEPIPRRRVILDDEPQPARRRILIED